MLRLILLGAPGAGKGSQAVKLAAEYKITHISTGDALRANIANKTELGLYAKSFIDRGALVPDEAVVGIVAERIKEPDCVNGFLLDGFPRTINQAEELSKLTDIDYVINLAVDFNLIAARIGGRRMCKCGATYHITTHSSPLCAKCGGTLYQRADDNEATVADRLTVYKKQTEPLIEYYRGANKLTDVDGNKSIEALFDDIKAILNGNN